MRRTALEVSGLNAVFNQLKRIEAIPPWHV
jgi:hypothetical protein